MLLFAKSVFWVRKEETSQVVGFVVYYVRWFMFITIMYDSSPQLGNITSPLLMHCTATFVAVWVCNNPLPPTVDYCGKVGTSLVWPLLATNVSVSCQQPLGPSFPGILDEWCRRIDDCKRECIVLLNWMIYNVHVRQTIHNIVISSLHFSWFLNWMQYSHFPKMLWFSAF